MTVSAIIQARMASSRLPGKALLPTADGTSLLEVQIKRVKLTHLVDQIIVATTDSPDDDVIEALADECEVACFRGPTDDVLLRYWLCAQEHKPDIIVRLTADCPLIDWDTIDRLVERVERPTWDYAQTHESYPEGLDVQVFTRQVLNLAQRGARSPHDREHLTPWFRRERGAVSMFELRHHPHMGHLRLTVDYPEDRDVVLGVIERVGPLATLAEILDLYHQHPEVFAGNQNIERNEWAKQGATA